MNKLSSPALIEVNRTKALFAFALFAQEELPAAKLAHLSDNEEDLSALELDDSIKTVNQSNFGQLVKQTPFQTFSPQANTPTTVKNNTLTKILDCADVSNYTTEASITHLNSRGILKKGAKARYSQIVCDPLVQIKEKQQFIQVIYSKEY